MLRAQASRPAATPFPANSVQKHRCAQVLAKHLDAQPECLSAFYCQLEGVLKTWFRDSQALARTAMGPPPVDSATTCTTVCMPC